MAVVKDSYTRSERDNDLIYHKEVPSLAALPAISPAQMVKVDVPNGLNDPQTVLHGDGVIFGELLAWGAKAAISMYLFSSQRQLVQQLLGLYNDRKNNLISEDIVAFSKALDDRADA